MVLLTISLARPELRGSSGGAAGVGLCWNELAQGCSTEQLRCGAVISRDAGLWGEQRTVQVKAGCVGL